MKLRESKEVSKMSLAEVSRLPEEFSLMDYEKNKVTDILPFGRMPSLHISVSGFTLMGTRFNSHYGSGPATFYYRIPEYVKSQDEVDRAARRIYDTFMDSYAQERESVKRDVKNNAISEDYRLQKKPKK